MVKPVGLDLDRLARELHRQMDRERLSLRAAAGQVGCSPATLARMLKGMGARHQPDTASLLRAASWLGCGLSDFETGRAPERSTIADVELHLRALADLTEKDRDALVAMVRAAHETYRLRSKKR